MTLIGLLVGWFCILLLAKDTLGSSPPLKTLADLSRALEAIKSQGNKINWDAASGLLTEQLAESFLTRFLDSKRIEDFVKSIPAGQDSLQVVSSIPVSKLQASKIKIGMKEDFLLGLKNISTNNSTIIVFGIISQLTDPRNPEEVLKKNNSVTYSLEIMPGHEASILYPLTLIDVFEERFVDLELTIHYMDKGSKKFGKVRTSVHRLELASVTVPWLDWQLILILVVSLSFLGFFGWLILQASLKPRKTRSKSK